MNILSAAMVFGVVFLIAGIAGFFPSPPPPDAPRLTLEHGHGLALGLLPINTLHNIVHLLFGIIGIAAARGAVMSARGYFQLVAGAYGLLTVMGLIPAAQTAFGLVPLWGNDVWFHLILALGALYFAFFVASTPLTRRT